MARICTVCTHPERVKIDTALASGECVKRHTAKRYGLQASSICRHERHHLDPRLIEAHERSLEAQDRSRVLSARQVVLDLVQDLRGMSDMMKVNGKVVLGGQFLEVADRLVRANEQYGKITKELGADQVHAMFVTLGVRGEDDLRRALDLTRGSESLSPAQVLDDACSAIELVLLKHPELRQDALRRIERASFVEVVESTNGDDQ